MPIIRDTHYFCLSWGEVRLHGDAQMSRPVSGRQVPTFRSNLLHFSVWGKKTSRKGQKIRGAVYKRRRLMSQANQRERQ